MPISEIVNATIKAMPGEAYFFENTETGKAVLQIDVAWRTAKAKAGISGRLRIHDCRDNFATLDIHRGVEIRTVAELIGDNPEVCLKRYCLINQKTMRQAVRMISYSVLGANQEFPALPQNDEPFISFHLN